MPRTMLHHRHYTADEANLQLDARRPHRPPHPRRPPPLAVEGFDTDFSTLAELTGGAWPGREHAVAALEVALGFDHLERLDVVVRDLERGLIDFPSLLDGEEVYLCWLLDEPPSATGTRWRRGFGGRRPLE